MDNDHGCCCFGMVNTSEVAVIEKCGAFDHYAEAGLVCIPYPFCTIASKITLKVTKLDVSLNTKTIDNVFVTVRVTVNMQVKRDDMYRAFYAVEYPQWQLSQYVKDGLRSAVCAMTLDDAYAGKQEISNYLIEHLQETFNNFGYTLMSVLITEIEPDSRVMNAMNEINSSKRLKEAAVQRAEGEKIIKVKQAEAEAESMHLSGIGVARQRRAIMDGLKNSIVMFNEGVSGTSSKDVMDLLILNQYFDTLDTIGNSKGMKTMFMPQNAKGSITNDILLANEASSSLI